jgi:hypothetical protein
LNHLPADWAQPLAETLCGAAELLFIVAILAIVLLGRSRYRWHERRIDYRITAELLRSLRLVAAFGGGRPFPQFPAHLAAYGGPESTWMGWYVRAVEREIGLPETKVDRESLQRTLRILRGVIAGQLDYHHHNAHRCRVLEHRLHAGGLAAFVLTLTACVLHLTHVLCRYGHVLTFCAGFFPAVAASLAGIANQAELRRLGKRSASMQAPLTSILERIAELEGEIEAAARVQASAPVVSLCSESMRLLVDEVLDWRVVQIDRPLETA